MLTVDVSKTPVAAAQFWYSHMSLLATLVPMQDSGPSMIHTEARATIDSWQRQLVSSAPLVYSEEHEVIDLVIWAQLSAIVWQVSSSNVLVAAIAVGVVMSSGRYGPQASCQLAISSSTKLSYEFPKTHCLNSPLHLE